MWNRQCYLFHQGKDHKEHSDSECGTDCRAVENQVGEREGEEQDAEEQRDVAGERAQPLEEGWRLHTYETNTCFMFYTCQQYSAGRLSENQRGRHRVDLNPVAALIRLFLSSLMRNDENTELASSYIFTVWARPIVSSEWCCIVFHGSSKTVIEY